MKRISLLFAALLVVVSSLAHAQPYFQFGNLNNGSVNVTSAWTKLNTTAGSHSFTKASATTKIEIHVNSRFGVGALGGGANGVRFQVRIDNTVVPAFENWGSLVASNSKDFISIFAVFPNLPAGAHRVSLWAQAAPGAGATAAAAVVDPGGWGGKIIVKETN